MEAARQPRAMAVLDGERLVYENAESSDLQTPPLNQRNTAPSSSEAQRGLRQLSLPTVGSTQAAADAAVAARRNESGMGASPDANDTGEAQRIRYFRRLSKLPAQPLDSTSLNTPILKFMDAARGILFALSQGLHAIKQHISVSNDDRLATLSQRGLSMASSSMNQLIQALDRLDTGTQLGRLEPVVVRRVLEASNDSLRTFRRMVTTFHAQLTQLEDRMDVRFSRTLLLLLYGSVAELRNSSAVMAPNYAKVQQYLADERPWADEDHPERAYRFKRTLDTPHDTNDSGALDSSLGSPRASTPLMQYGARNRAESVSSLRSPGWPNREALKSVNTPQVNTTLSPTKGSPQVRLRSISNTSREDSTVDSQLRGTLEQVTTQAVRIWTDLHTDLQKAQPTSDENARRLRDVDATCLSTLEQTKQLRTTISRLPTDEMNMRLPLPEYQQVWEQANHFVRVCHKSSPSRPLSRFRR
ncbi:RAM signaling network component [Malassezia yamatoensis]|uniref:RAM signaling network component n=1 Tax=Malassezia yamatoensis TaxID=253288 RepID=A0AAJ5YP82_9BASI|nr:RAM signaling network component [Malassezia yamatoensis]